MVLKGISTLFSTEFWLTLSRAVRTALKSLSPEHYSTTTPSDTSDNSPVMLTPLGFQLRGLPLIKSTETFAFSNSPKSELTLMTFEQEFHQFVKRYSTVILQNAVTKMNLKGSLVTKNSEWDVLTVRINL